MGRSRQFEEILSSYIPETGKRSALIQELDYNNLYPEDFPEPDGIDVGDCPYWNDMNIGVRHLAERFIVRDGAEEMTAARAREKALALLAAASFVESNEQRKSMNNMWQGAWVLPNNEDEGVYSTLYEDEDSAREFASYHPIDTQPRIRKWDAETGWGELMEVE